LNWLQVEIDLGEFDPEPVEAALLDLGAVSVWLSDAADEPILEPGPGETPLWRQIRLTGLMPADVNPDFVRLGVAAAVQPAALPAMRFETLAERDWIATWQQSLAPVMFGQGLWICPHGSRAPESASAVVWLDPGLAFGTGSHPTTAMCLEWLTGIDNPGTVLDFGCGSGILALASAALGASGVWAIDNDPQALLATRENAIGNGSEAKLTIAEPAQLSSAQCFDTVVANILSGTLISLAGTLAAHCRPGGRIALSGILEHQAASVTAAFKPWVRFTTPRIRDGWVLLAGIAETAS
jgi:ribosomal protein L11 methyltransferase